MNYITGQMDRAGHLSGGNNIAGSGISDISLIIKEKITSSLLEILKPGSIIEADLIGVSTGDAGSPLSGILNINGKLLTAVIPEDLYNEFALGKAFDNNFNIPVKLMLESAVKNAAANEGGGNGAIEVVFKIIANPSDNINIQKAVDIYRKAFAGNLESNIGAAFKSLSASGLNASIQSVTAEVKGNFLFIHINFGAAFGFGSVILTSERNSYIKDAPDKKNLNAAPKKYMLMLETEFNQLGYIKLFSYYSDKFLSVKFQECPAAAVELINKNLEVFKEMLSKDGITLKDISFKASGDKDLKGGADVFGAGGEMFSGGKIINERV